MNKYLKTTVRLSIAFLLSLMIIWGRAQVVFKTKQFVIQIDASGKLASMKSIALQKEFLADKNSYILSLKKDGNILNPQACTWKQKTGELQLHFPHAGMEATVKVQQYDNYIKFELKQLTQAGKLDWIQWGPFPTTIADTIGEVVGVVRDKDFAIGIQALNIKTLGGSPLVDSDIQPAYDVFAEGNKVDVLKDDLHKQLFRGDVAKPMPYGSLLQAYARNRNKDRVIDNWSHPRYLAPAYTADGGVVGSALALFGVANGEALPTLGAIEQKEGLPHPIFDGVWGKEARHATASYLIMDFGEQNLRSRWSSQSRLV